MAGLYGIFLALQLFSLLNIHITASNRVQYKEKLKKKNPQCAREAFGTSSHLVIIFAARRQNGAQKGCTF